MTTETEIAVSAEPQADVSVEVENQEATTEATEDGDAPKAPELTAEERLRKAENKIRHDREKIAKARARNARLAEEAAQYKAEVERYRAEREQKATGPKEPQEGDYDNVLDYIKAFNKYQTEQAFAERESKTPKQPQTSPQQYQEQLQVQQRLQTIDAEAEKFAAEVPDAAEVFADVEDTLRELPPAIQRLLLLAPNGPQAVYNLAKEGRLDNLGYLPPEIAAVEIQRAQGPVTKPVSKAPAPIASAKGNVAGEKSLEAKSGKELLKWVNS